jgi:hypothetical protein
LYVEIHEALAAVLELEKIPQGPSGTILQQPGSGGQVEPLDPGSLGWQEASLNSSADLCDNRRLILGLHRSTSRWASDRKRANGDAPIYVTVTGR